MTDALNPTLPVGGSQVEIASELRGIKQRLVTDKTNITALQALTVPLATLGATGAALLPTATPAQARTVIGGTVIGQDIFTAVDLAAAQSLLGITSQVEQIHKTGGKVFIEFGGGLQINIIQEVIGVNVEQHYWHTPFTSELFGIVCTINDNGTEAAFIQGATLAYCFTDQSNANSKLATIIAFGR